MGSGRQLTNRSVFRRLRLKRNVATQLPSRSHHDTAPRSLYVSISVPGRDGSGIVIAIIDSGVYDHAELRGVFASRVVYRQSFIGGSRSDDFGHGTHVAGIAGGNGSSSSKPGAFRTFKGIAPNAKLLD